jgi:ABC-type Na+ efflux pump permease subunit
MTKPILLIAEREFRTYVATLSFWLALAIAPAMSGAVMLFAGAPAQPVAVSISGATGALADSARQALEEVGRLEGRSFVFAPGGVVLTFTRPARGTLEMSFGGQFPLSPESRALIGRTIERDMARGVTKAPSLAVHEKIVPSASPDTRHLSRLAAMVMLWLTLTGSLGMLLQAVVRERANRALESLLAAAQGWEIVTGKMLGVGAVSLLVLATWLGSVVMFSFFLSSQGGLVSTIFADLAQPLELLRDTVIYLCAFVFYGAATVALGAVARDSASAQNAVRPMFVLLLAAFFIALGAPAQSGAVSWLAYIPPFTPFLLLVNSPDSVAPEIQGLLLALLLVAGLFTTLLAARFLSVAPRSLYIFTALSRHTQPVV